MQRALARVETVVVESMVRGKDWLILVVDNDNGVEVDELVLLKRFSFELLGIQEGR